MTSAQFKRHTKQGCVGKKTTLNEDMENRAGDKIAAGEEVEILGKSDLRFDVKSVSGVTISCIFYAYVEQFKESK